MSDFEVTYMDTDELDGRIRDENAELRELVELMWQTHCGPPTAYGWVAVMEDAKSLGITLEYPE